MQLTRQVKQPAGLLLTHHLFKLLIMYIMQNEGMLRHPISQKIMPDWLMKWQPILLFSLLLMVWFTVSSHIHQLDPTATVIDQGMWLMVILSMISFLLIVALCWWLLSHFWVMMGLPTLSSMVSQFNILSLWQQLGLYWASFVMLLLAASACLIALC